MNNKILKLLGKKWTISVILELERYQLLRFNQLKHNIGNISSATLASTLKELKAHNMIQRYLLDDYLTPAYSLTENGASVIQEVVGANVVSDSSKETRVIKLSDSTEKKIKKLQKRYFIKNKGESVDFATVTENLIKKGLDSVNLKNIVIGSASFAGLGVLCLDHSLEIMRFCESLH